MSRSLGSIATAISFAILLTACSSPWPGLRVHIDGLGNAPLGHMLQSIWMSSDKGINEGAKSLLARQEGTPRERALAAGMQCDPLPSRRCHYEGFVLHEPTGPKLSNPDAAGRQREDIAITWADHDDVATLRTVKRISTPS